MPSLSGPLARRCAALTLFLIFVALSFSPSVSSQTPPEPVPSKWLHNGKLVAEKYNFSINFPTPNSQWSYSRLADIDGSKATAFIVEASKDSRFFVAVWDQPSSIDSDLTRK